RKELLKLPYEERLAVLRELVSDPKLLDVSTAPNTAVFYSGRVRTLDPSRKDLVGFVSARSLAEGMWSQGKTTLERTPGGNFLEQLDLYEGDVIKPDDADAIWKTLSERYSHGASGDVFVFQGDMRPNAVLPHELKVLTANQSSGQIEKIKIVDM